MNHQTFSQNHHKWGKSHHPTCSDLHPRPPWCVPHCCILPSLLDSLNATVVVTGTSDAHDRWRMLISEIWCCKACTQIIIAERNPNTRKWTQRTWLYPANVASALRMTVTSPWACWFKTWYFVDSIYVIIRKFHCIEIKHSGVLKHTRSHTLLKLCVKTHTLETVCYCCCAVLAFFFSLFFSSFSVQCAELWYIY